jgi:teichuronic acid biosynthesis glycosyltransferase TuaG
VEIDKSTIIDQPLVSIITPLYNKERFVLECIKSVLNQIYQNWEWIIVDDKSNDDSVKIITPFAEKDNRINLILSPENQGAGPARNTAIKQAKGKYIAFLDSDDIWTNDKLSVHINFMEQDNMSFSHTSYGYIDEDGKRIRETFHVSKQPVSYKDLLKRTEISCLTAIFNADILGKRYMPTIRRKQDYALWLNILKEGHKSVPLDKELAFYRQVRGSNTSNKFKLIISHWQFLYYREKLGIFDSFRYLFHWAYNGFFRYYL